MMGTAERLDVGSSLEANNRDHETNMLRGWVSGIGCPWICPTCVRTVVLLLTTTHTHKFRLRVPIHLARIVLGERSVLGATPGALALHGDQCALRKEVDEWMEGQESGWVDRWMSRWVGEWVDG